MGVFFFFSPPPLLIWPHNLNSKWRGASKAGWLTLGVSLHSVTGSFHEPCPSEGPRSRPGYILSQREISVSSLLVPCCHKVPRLVCVSHVEENRNNNNKKEKKTLSYCCTRWNLQRAWFMLVYSLHVMTFKGCIHEIYIYNNTLIAPTLEREREWK